MSSRGLLSIETIVPLTFVEAYRFVHCVGIQGMVALLPLVGILWSLSLRDGRRRRIIVARFIFVLLLRLRLPLVVGIAAGRVGRYCDRQ